MGGKSTYLVISDGRHIANQIAGSGERAIQLASVRYNLNPRYTKAIQMTNTANLDKAIELACLETINFQPLA